MSSSLRLGRRAGDPLRTGPRRAVAPLGDMREAAADSGCRGGAVSEIRVLSRLAERIQGLKGSRDWDGHVILVPCRDIHTFGMAGPIDAAFVDEAGIVMAVHRAIMPNRRIRHARARLVVERGSRAGRWLECGDRLFDFSFQDGVGCMGNGVE